MSQLGRPRVPQPKGPTEPLMRPPGLGKLIGFGSFNPDPEAENASASRFPRPEVESSPIAEDAAPAKPPPERRVKYYQPPSTTLSDTDSDREKELEHLRIRMVSLENEVRKEKEEK